MIANIVCDDVGWIYSRFIEKLKQYSVNEIVLNSKEKADVNYFLPYYNFKLSTTPSIIWSSHQELSEPLHSKFISSAKQADWCLSPSLKYLNLLKQNGVSRVSQCRHGVDLDLFRPLYQKRNSDKLIVGAVGRSYKSSTRKNERLMEKISKLPFVDFRFTGGKLTQAEVAKFINDCDIMVQTSVIEGGSMAVTESLACGVPILTYFDVGVANEFGLGVLKAGFGNETSYIKILTDFWSVKWYELYQIPEQREIMRAQVETHTWQNFVKTHDEIFDKLVNKCVV